MKVTALEKYTMFWVYEDLELRDLNWPDAVCAHVCVCICAACVCAHACPTDVRWLLYHPVPSIRQR